MTVNGPGNVPENNGRRVDTYGRDLSRPDVPGTPLHEDAQKWLLHHSLRLVHGPGKVSCGADEVIVLVVARDGRPFVKSFVEHYRSLGARHIVFLDNGSTDGTVEALKGYEDVTVFRTTLPFKRYGLSMRKYLVERFGPEHIRVRAEKPREPRDTGLAVAHYEEDRRTPLQDRPPHPPLPPLTPPGARPGVDPVTVRPPLPRVSGTGRRRARVESLC